MADRSAPSDDRPAVAVEGLGKRFGDVTAVADVSFTVPVGATVGLLGANGAGKTTTVAMLLGLLIPSSGSIRIFGESVPQHRDRVLARMSFSSPYIDLPKRLTVRQNLEVYAGLYGVGRIGDRLRELAADLELGEFMDRHYGTLSAGQQTRVMFAKALLNEPELLLLDEPTASLDPDTADWVRGYLESYQRATGAAILLASHNMAEVERLCSHVLMMRRGRIVDRGRPAELIARYGRGSLEEVFLHIARAPQGEAAE